LARKSEVTFPCRGGRAYVGRKTVIKMIRFLYGLHSRYDSIFNRTKVINAVGVSTNAAKTYGEKRPVISVGTDRGSE